MIGQTLSQFKITAKLGEGGMGAVYRAEDTNLGREVALKILPEAFVDDAERFARFQREAHVLASLNHPNIAAIYDLAEADGVHFLVLELAEGEDLAARLARGRMATEDAIAIAGKISEALEAAHEKGIVHRDLKPANVMVSPQGTVKVLDFGLAKAWEAEKADDAGLSLSPTLTAQMTQAGVILGTASYMSPEQARGLTVDRRADIWAFGVMLLEMLSGARTFEGETVTDILAAVVRVDPDLSAVADAVPQPIRWLLRRCLEKDPSRRLRDIGEARVLLDDAVRGGVDVEEATSPVAESTDARSPWLSAAILALAVGALAFFLGQRTGSAPATTASAGLDSSLMVRKLTFLPGLENEPAISPDGNYVAYTSNESGSLDIMVLPLAGGSHTPVVTHPADDAQPAWSPDGTQIAFISARDQGGRLNVMTGTGALTPHLFSRNGDIFLAPAFGGPASKLIDNGSHPTWSPDGQQIAFESRRDGSWQIWTVSSRGGTPVRVTNEDGHVFEPAWSPDGQWIAYATLNALKVVPATGGDAHEIATDFVARFGPEWSPDSRSVTFSSSLGGRFNLWRVRFDPNAPASAEPERVTLGEGDDVEAAYGPQGHTLAYSKVTVAPDIWELDPSTGEMRQVTHMTSTDDYPHLSPDGETLALNSTRSGQIAVWTADRDGGSMRKITPDGVGADMARWSPDGRSLAYTEHVDGIGRRLVVHKLGELAGRPIDTGSEGFNFPIWSPDGTRFAVSMAGDLIHGDISVVDLGGSVTKLTDGPLNDAFPSWSPDGEWIAFNRADAGFRGIWIMRSDGTDPRPITDDETLDFSHPSWSPTDADRVLMTVGHKNLATVSVSTGEIAYLTNINDVTTTIDYPTWSVDGRLIHFSISQRKGDVFLMAPDPTAGSAAE